MFSLLINIEIFKTYFCKTFDIFFFFIKLKYNIFCSLGLKNSHKIPKNCHNFLIPFSSSLKLSNLNTQTITITR